MSLTNTELALGDTKGGNDTGASDPLQAGTRVRYFGDYEIQKVLGEPEAAIRYVPVFPADPSAR
jgi:hypothetical protein